MRVLLPALCCSLAMSGVPSWADEAHIVEPNPQPAVTQDDLYNLPADVANRLRQLMRHGPRYEDAIRATVDLWASKGASVNSHCGGVGGQPFADTGV